MTYTMQPVLIPGAHASGVDVSAERSGWQRKRPCVLAFDYPTVNGTPRGGAPPRATPQA